MLRGCLPFLRFVCHVASLVKLPVEACVGPGETIQIFECRLQLRFVYLGQPTQLVFGKTESIGPVKESHSLVVVRLGNFSIKKVFGDRRTWYRVHSAIFVVSWTPHKGPIEMLQNAVLLVGVARVPD